MLNVADHKRGNQSIQERNLTCVPIRKGIEPKGMQEISSGQ